MARAGHGNRATARCGNRGASPADSNTVVVVARCRAARAGNSDHASTADRTARFDHNAARHPSARVGALPHKGDDATRNRSACAVDAYPVGITA